MSTLYAILSFLALSLLAIAAWLAWALLRRPDKRVECFGPEPSTEMILRVYNLLKEAKEQMPVDEEASAAFLADPYLAPVKIKEVLHRRKRTPKTGDQPVPVCPKGFLQKSRAYIKAMLLVIPPADEAASERDSDESERRWESLPKRPILRKRDPSEATTANKETNDA
jgi:hypothetical protein